MSNTRKKQAKRRARKKTSGHGRNGHSAATGLAMNEHAAMHAWLAAEHAGVDGFAQTVAAVMGAMMSSDRWEVGTDPEVLIPGLAYALECDEDKITAALDALVAAGVMETT